MGRVTSISLIDIARTGKFGPISLGGRLSDFANEIGPPARWGDFSDKKRLSCLMVFGQVEVGFIADQDDLIVTWAKITLARFTRSQMKFGRNRDGDELRILNPFARRYPQYDFVANEIRQAGLRYTTDYGEWRRHAPPLIMRFGLVTFYFHDEERSLMSVNLEEYV